MVSEMQTMRQELDRLAARMQYLEEELRGVMGARELRAKARRDMHRRLNAPLTDQEREAIDRFGESGNR